LIQRVYRGEMYSITGVNFHVCPDCGEKFYDQAATDKIQSHSPAYKSATSKRVRRAG
jgi:hypothetical protein